jgi:hypothetical protein
MDTPQSTLTVREYPFGSWLVGLFLLGFGLYPYYNSHGTALFMLIPAGIGLLILLITAIVVVTADRNSQTVTLRWRGPLRWRNKEIAFGDISAVEVQSTSGSSRSGTSYRIAIMLSDGKVVPFHTSYTSGSLSKERKAKQLREFLGVGGQDGTPSGMINLVQQAARQNLQEQLGTAPGSDGVRWTVQANSFGSAPITRWFSSDFQCPGMFVFVAQNVAGQKQIGGLLAGVGTKLAEAAMQIYGFTGEDTPGLAGAQLLSPVDPRLETSFTVLVSEQAAGQRLLNTYVVQALADWAARYPLQQMPNRPVLQQVAVLFGPRGVYVAAMGTVMPEIVDELKNLGMALVKAQ